MNRWLKYGGIEVEPSKIPVNLIDVKDITLVINREGNLIKFPANLYFNESFRIITNGAQTYQGIATNNTYDPGNYKLTIDVTVNKQNPETRISARRRSNNSVMTYRSLMGSGIYTLEFTADDPFYISLLTNFGSTGDNYSADIIVNNINLIKV